MILELKQYITILNSEPTADNHIKVTVAWPAGKSTDALTQESDIVINGQCYKLSGYQFSDLIPELCQLIVKPISL